MRRKSSTTFTSASLADVLVTNPAGHSFPSGVGFRRAFVNFQVLDQSGKELWASGDTSPEGVILGEKNKPLVTEFFSPKQQVFQPGSVATFENGEGEQPERNWAARFQAARSNSLSMN